MLVDWSLHGTTQTQGSVMYIVALVWWIVKLLYVSKGSQIYLSAAEMNYNLLLHFFDSVHWRSFGYWMHMKVSTLLIFTYLICNNFVVSDIQCRGHWSVFERDSWQRREDLGFKNCISWRDTVCMCEGKQVSLWPAGSLAIHSTRPYYSFFIYF